MPNFSRMCLECNKYFPVIGSSNRDLCDQCLKKMGREEHCCHWCERMIHGEKICAPDLGEPVAFRRMVGEPPLQPEIKPALYFHKHSCYEAWVNRDENLIIDQKDLPDPNPSPPPKKEWKTLECAECHDKFITEEEGVDLCATCSSVGQYGHNCNRCGRNFKSNSTLGQECPECHMADHKSLKDCQERGDVSPPKDHKRRFDHIEPFKSFPGIEDREIFERERENADREARRTGKCTVTIGLTDRGLKEIEDLKENFVSELKSILDREIKVGPLEGP